MMRAGGASWALPAGAMWRTTTRSRRWESFSTGFSVTSGPNRPRPLRTLSQHRSDALEECEARLDAEDRLHPRVVADEVSFVVRVDVADVRRLAGRHLDQPDELANRDDLVPGDVEDVGPLELERRAEDAHGVFDVDRVDSLPGPSRNRDLVALADLLEEGRHDHPLLSGPVHEEETKDDCAEKALVVAEEGLRDVLGGEVEVERISRRRLDEGFVAVAVDAAGRGQEERLRSCPARVLEQMERRGDVDCEHVLRSVGELPVAARLGKVDHGVDALGQAREVEWLGQVLDDPLARVVGSAPHDGIELVLLLQPFE